ncbi:hypothetical protein PQE75_gp204 [Bacillus phage vB_BcoS-136]|uniref:Concanavalin A-like lectin/glucanases superfamily protein n=1 Tax=Bacillus phage vB_BcoS-136 TaxID=2419619 RepID=A0A3G3BVJ1_9CAUD|nr:hypothetical protein PQE75_gp204 [Bacillus phage vB_BcoS-136]AYP68275.1 hypothetical protein vBBcoS136_00161 [Bacillus phage vB_BcoS-136]
MSQIVTDGLVGYWHYKQGLDGGLWKNISPNTEGKYDGLLNGVTLTSKGVYFDGVDDFVLLQTDFTFIPYSIEFIIDKSEQTGSQDTLIYLNSSETVKSALSISSDELHQRRIGSSTGTINSIFTIEKNKDIHIVLSNPTGSSINYYKDGVKFSRSGSVSSAPISSNGLIEIGKREFNGLNWDYFHGHIKAIRIYNRQLSDEEVLKNYSVGEEIGLPINEKILPPIVNVESSNFYKISNNQSMDSAIVSFSFNQDVEEYKLNLLGVSHDTGTNIVLEFGSYNKDVTIIQAIYYDNILQEGENRINIYGKNKDGIWTPYDNKIDDGKGGGISV